MDTRNCTVPELNDTAMDKYTASIELSNACRQFYKSRVEEAHCIKSRWAENRAHSTCNDNDRPADANSNIVTTKTRQRNSIDDAMIKLRTEMSSLMEQDLSLMKQLLTLNETIEDLKWQRRYYYAPRSLSRSSADLHCSALSVSDTEMYDSEDDSFVSSAAIATSTAATTCQTPVMLLSAPSSSTSGRRLPASDHVTTAHAFDNQKRYQDSQILAAGSTVKVYHSEQDSFDSGIHETGSEEEASV